MLPKLHAKGSSFGGVAAYVLHDKDRAKSSDRVAWTATRNLATKDPQAAWMVMAFTAMDQARLKEQAGIKNTGRKSNDHVLHFTLSWHPDEAKDLTSDEMMRAALGAIGALKAQDRQALIVCHNDEEQPHVHLVVNRVSPIDGRMLSSSKEKLELSRWALAYEEERGKILCEQRALNNAARDRGEFTRGKKDKPRHIYELEATNDNTSRAAWIKAQEKTNDLKRARETRAMQERHRRAWHKLQAEHRQRAADIRAQIQKEIAARQSEVREHYRPAWARLFQKHQTELQKFNERESQLFGRVHNTLKSIDFAAIVRAGDRRSAITQAFRALASKGERTAAHQRAQLQEGRALAAQQSAAEKTEVAKTRLARKDDLARNRQLFFVKRDSLKLKQASERLADREAWHTRRKERIAAWQKEPFGHKKQWRTQRQSEPQPEQSNISSNGESRAMRAAAFLERQRQQEKDAQLERAPALPQLQKDFTTAAQAASEQQATGSGDRASRAAAFNEAMSQKSGHNLENTPESGRTIE